LIYFTTFGGFIALTAWFPTYWKSFYVVTPLTAGALTALFSLTASAIRVTGGTIADRIGGVQTLMLSLVVLLIGAAGIGFSQVYILSILGAVAMGIGMGTSNAAVFKLMPQYVPNAVGGASGWIGGLGAFGGFVIPPVLGAIVRSQGQAGYPAGFFTFTALALVSLGLTYLLKRSQARPEKTAAAGITGR
jgi:NNP family nitrate/nitrite transporter-like MFS transporter